MGPSEALHLLVGAPAKLQSDMNAALAVGAAVRCVERDSEQTRIANDRHPAFSRLKLLHRVNVRTMHWNAVRGALLILNLTGLAVADEAPVATALQVNKGRRKNGRSQKKSVRSITRLCRRPFATQSSRTHPELFPGSKMLSSPELGRGDFAVPVSARWDGGVLMNQSPLAASSLEAISLAHHEAFRIARL